MLQRQWRLAGTLALLAGQAPALAGPAGQALPARGTDSAFFITRSTNRNQVHYGIRVREDCHPDGPRPVHAYWRMLEKGESRVEPLLGVEGPAYGLGDTQQITPLEHGWRVRIWLRAYPGRPIDVDVFRENGHCAARAWMQVGGSIAQLERIFVKAAWPTGVDYVMISGVDPQGRSAREVVHQ